MEALGRVDYDSELQRYREALSDIWGIGPNDRVLDIGCGAGQTTCDAARAAKSGSALGVDISTAMIDRARERAENEGVRNVAFAQADAATYSFDAETFDVVISRFGTMFFDDPPAAFAHLARALRKNGRLAMLVWQDAEKNEWTASIQRALAAHTTESDQDSTTPNAFSLADPDAVGRILSRANFTDGTSIAIREPVYYGADVGEALDWVRGFATVKGKLDRMAAPERERALAALTEMLAAHDTGRGVWFDSQAWFVTARRA